MVTQKFNITSLRTRLLTALLLGVLLVGVWWIGGWLVFLLVLSVSSLALWEVYTLFLPRKDSLPAKVYGIGLGGAFLLVAWLAPGYPVYLILIAMVLVLALSGLLLWEKENSAAQLRNAVIVLCGLAYIPLLLAPALRFSRPELALVVVLPAFSDMAAYFVGVGVGQHKIWPAISPKKSVEGSIAGLLASVLVCLILGWGWGQASLWSFVFLGIFLGILAQLGDFFESALKRTAGVKDSGNLLPGHGGVLDRIDSVLFCCAAYAVFEPLMGFFG